MMQNARSFTHIQFTKIDKTFHKKEIKHTEF